MVRPKDARLLRREVNDAREAVVRPVHELAETFQGGRFQKTEKTSRRSLSARVFAPSRYRRRRLALIALQRFIVLSTSDQNKKTKVPITGRKKTETVTQDADYAKNPAGPENNELQRRIPKSPSHIAIDSAHRPQKQNKKQKRTLERSRWSSLTTAGLHCKTRKLLDKGAGEEK